MSSMSFAIHEDFTAPLHMLIGLDLASPGWQAYQALYLCNGFLQVRIQDFARGGSNKILST